MIANRVNERHLIKMDAKHFLFLWVDEWIMCKHFIKTKILHRFQLNSFSTFTINIFTVQVKSVKLLDRALVMESLPIADFMTISRDRNISEPSGSTPQARAADLEASLPRDLGEKNSALDQMIQDRLTKFLETRTIQLHVPKDVFEGMFPRG